MKTYQFALGTGRGSERLTRLSAVPAIFEKMTGERRHLTVVRKWTKRKGPGEIALPTITIGGRIYTSEAAILWWLTATNTPEDASTVAPVAGQLTPAELAGLERVGVLPREAV